MAHSSPDAVRGLLLRYFIKRVIIPEVFKPYVDIPEGVPVCWCGLKADYYNEDDDLDNADDGVLKRFSMSAPLMDSTWYNFFVGKNKDGTALFLYNVQYIFHPLTPNDHQED